MVRGQLDEGREDKEARRARPPTRSNDDEYVGTVRSIREIDTAAFCYSQIINTSRKTTGNVCPSVIPSWLGPAPGPAFSIGSLSVLGAPARRLTQGLAQTSSAQRARAAVNIFQNVIEPIRLNSL